MLRVKQDLAASLNWFHIRCLSHWSERYVHLHCQEEPQARETLLLILEHLRPLRPDMAPPLTIREELQEMATARQEPVILADGPEPETIEPEKLH
jgi:hypothetical protein